MMTSGKPEEYKYLLRVGVASSYLAEGNFHFPAFDDDTHAFIYQLRDAGGPNNKWEISLGEGTSRVSGIPKNILPYLLKLYASRKEIPLKESKAERIADTIIAALEQRFLPQVQTDGFLRLCHNVTAAVAINYQSTLEQHLAKNPHTPILPRQYRYDIDEEPFDKAKLMKV